jgi:hypothetical protein
VIKRLATPTALRQQQETIKMLKPPIAKTYAILGYFDERIFGSKLSKLRHNRTHYFPLFILIY